MARKSKLSSETEKEVFPSRLSELMDETIPKTTQETLAQYLGITRQAVGFYKSGQSSPDFSTLIKIAKYFNVSTDWLLGISDIRSSDTDLQAVCEYTGLSEKAIDNIAHIRLRDTPAGAKISPFKALDLLLSSRSLSSLVTTLAANHGICFEDIQSENPFILLSIEAKLKAQYGVNFCVTTGETAQKVKQEIIGEMWNMLKDEVLYPDEPQPTSQPEYMEVSDNGEQE
jgi:transcriptional regulator with XRE-family HTH domain